MFTSSVALSIYFNNNNNNKNKTRTLLDISKINEFYPLKLIEFK